MNFNNFTIKSQEIVQKAIDLTRQAGQQQIEPVHILKAMISESETILNFIFQKLGVPMPTVVQGVESAIASLPKVSGGLFQVHGRRVCIGRGYADGNTPN